jgi:hypothetical protein
MGRKSTGTYGPRGNGTVTQYGYVMHTANGKKTFAHVVAAERALGRPLPVGTEVHHVNGIRTDNSPSNLVICPSKAYHKLLHVRSDALSACGNASFRKCPFCKQYSDPGAMTHNKASRYFYHPACKSEYRRAQKQGDAK